MLLYLNARHDLEPILSWSPPSPHCAHPIPESSTWSYKKSKNLEWKELKKKKSPTGVASNMCKVIYQPLTICFPPIKLGTLVMTIIWWKSVPEFDDNKTKSWNEKWYYFWQKSRNKFYLVIRANNLQFCHGWGREGERDYDGTKKYPKMS